MLKQEIIEKIKALGLPAGSFIAFGSTPMAALGIRESQDIDLFVSRAIYDKFKAEGWEVKDKGFVLNPLEKGDFEIYARWNMHGYEVHVDELLKSALIVDGIPFVNIEEVRKWKSALGRPKDQRDVELIDAYLTS